MPDKSTLTVRVRKNSTTDQVYQVTSSAVQVRPLMFQTWRTIFEPSFPCLPSSSGGGDEAGDGQRDSELFRPVRGHQPHLRCVQACNQARLLLLLVSENPSPLAVGVRLTLVPLRIVGIGPCSEHILCSQLRSSHFQGWHGARMCQPFEKKKMSQMEQILKRFCFAHSSSNITSRKSARAARQQHSSDRTAGRTHDIILHDLVINSLLIYLKCLYLTLVLLLDDMITSSSLRGSHIFTLW